MPRSVRGRRLPGRALALLAALVLPAAAAHAAAPAADLSSPALIARGAYIAKAADCMPCHSAVGGAEWAGGLPLATPFGALYSPNVTPDKATGIGRWSEAQFYRTLHDGIGRGGKYIYPVMPFTSYTKLTRDDVHALWAYMRSLKPVQQPNRPNGLNFPFNIRLSLLGWRILFFSSGTYKPDPHQSAAWNRGAYLVEGAAHCGECHSPRNVMGATIQSASYQGGVADNWWAPNISSDKADGIGNWSQADIAAFLKNGVMKGGGVSTVVFGPMTEVVHDSMRFMSDSDINDMALYIKSLKPRPVPMHAPRTPTQRLADGRRLYIANCASCHQDKGQGVAGAFPNLAGNPAVTAADPNSVVMAVLDGLQGVNGYGQMPSFASALNDTEIADVVNYVRSDWGNKPGRPARPEQVASFRPDATTTLAGSEMARAFGCPKVGDGSVPGVMASDAQVNVMAGATRGDAGNRLAILVHAVQSGNPAASPADIVNAVNAAYCPVIASERGLTVAQKHDALLRLAAVVGGMVQQGTPASGSSVVMGAPLDAASVARITQAADAAHETPAQYVARTLAPPTTAKPATGG